MEFCGDGWHQNLHWPIFGTKFRQKMAFFGCNFFNNSLKKKFLTIFFVPHVGTNTKSKIKQCVNNGKIFFGILFCIGLV